MQLLFCSLFICIFLGWHVHISINGHVFGLGNFVALGVFLSNNSYFVVFWSRSVPRVRKSDARISAEHVLVHMLGVSRTVCNGGKPNFCNYFFRKTNGGYLRVFGKDRQLFFQTEIKLGTFQTVFVFFIIKYEPVTYGSHYKYPWWGEGLGITLSLISMVWIPLYAAYYLITEPGTLKQVTHQWEFKTINNFNNITYYLKIFLFFLLTLNCVF